MGKTPQDVLDMIKENNVKIVDFRFTDYPGLWQHFSVPAEEVEEDTFEDGLGFDGSSMRGWQSIHESDLLVMPEADTAFVDPFLEIPTLALFCEIQDPITRGQYTRDPRTVARRAEVYLRETGIADEATFGPEAEFFVFDDIRFDQTNNTGYYYVDSVEGRWNTGRDEQPNLGYKPRYKEGYFPVPPTDSLQDIRSEMVLHMINCGIEVEAHHHEVATGGQAEIDFRFAPLLSCADKLILYKYIVKNTARKHGRTATFMPKPLFQDNGTGMHVHQSLWKDGEPLFAGSEYAGLSDMALHYIGGILKHANALLAFVAPTTNSYKRLVPGYEAPVNLAYSKRNRSACVRIPMYSPSPKAKRMEFRCPDPSCNPYLAFAAMLMAGLDGIRNRIDPGEPLDMDLYELEPEDMARVPQTCGSLEEAINALEADHDFLLEGDVFTRDVVDSWIDYKRKNEIDEMRLRPHPYEFALYFDA
ncbi:MAG: type I glutamate--ammonia ligase [Gemmatimonadota bacterium]|nr:type I glutamate--ammonia ligase [Gemmatimonadota bacterium]